MRGVTPDRRDTVDILTMVAGALLAAFAVSLTALIGSAALLSLGSRAEKASVWILSYAIGTLTGAATIHLLPEALERRTADEVMLLLLVGMLLFIAFERLIRWRHTHVHVHGAEHIEPTAQIILWGDGLHNAIDGIIIGVSFSASPELGVVTFIAVFAHEVPQEIGDFAVLLSSGMPRKRALLLNYLSAFMVIPGAAAGLAWSNALGDAVYMLLPVAAGSFLYIALADLVPTMHHDRRLPAAVLQLLLIVLGAATIWWVSVLFGHA